MKNYSVTQKFEVSVTPVGENQYLLRTEQVALGVPLAEDIVVWPIELWLSQAALEGLSPSDNPADILPHNWVYLDYRWEENRGIAPRQSNSFSSPSSFRLSLSREIYNALWQGTLGNSWITAKEIANSRREVLQVRLLLKDDRLVSLPWELVDLGEYVGKGQICWQEASFAADSLDANSQELNSLELQDWEMENRDREDSEDGEDTAFISGLLTQFSSPHSVSESASDNYAENSSIPVKPESLEKLTPQPIETARTSVSSNVNQPRKKQASRSIDRFGNLRSIFNTHILPLQKKQLVLWSLAFFLTASSLLFARSRWMGWRTVNYLPEVSTTTPATKPLPKRPSIDLHKLTNSKLAQMAVKNFRQGDITTGQEMVEALLNRNAIPQTKVALATVPQNQKNNPNINFLYGRLAWQSVRSGDKKYTIDDATRYWEIAVKQQPKSPLYHNALGFAYYAQGNIIRANQAWFEALYRSQEEQAAETESNSRQDFGNGTPTPAKLATSNDSLTAYAGLSLVLWRSAQNQPPDKRSRLLAKAIELHQKVMRDDPLNFQPEALKTNWLWTPQAIQDWKKEEGRGVRG